MAEMTCLPLPDSLRQAPETESQSRFVALLDRLAEREAARDRRTGLTADEATSEWSYRSRARLAYHRRVESAHNPLLMA